MSMIPQEGTRTAKAKAGAIGSLAGSGGGFVVLYAINEVLPDAPWWARMILFCVVAGIVGYLTVYKAPRNGAV